jgi:hypothetical protein
MESRLETTAAVHGLHFAVAGRQSSLLLVLLFVGAAAFLAVAERLGWFWGKSLTRYILLEGEHGIESLSLRMGCRLDETYIEVQE